MPSQEIRKYFGGFVIIGLLVAQVACSTTDHARIGSTTAPSPIDRIIKDRGVIDGMVLDHKGGLTVIEAISGEVVPSCNELEKGGVRKCKYRFGKDQTPEGIKIISDRRIRIIDYVGSHCRSYVDDAGDEYEVCRPPYKK